jgi:NADH-quinone oxidoreductase subunit E
LRQIKGIGLSIEKTLRELGFQRFHQIAEMTEYDIDRVARQLKGFRSRIYREDWIGQARLLQNQKNNSPS